MSKPTIGSKAKAQMKMSQRTRGFAPDTRGIGGKQMVVEILALHQYRLNKIKATPKAAPPPPKIKGAGQYSTNAFKMGFSGPPSTYNLAPKLSQARKAHTDESVAEHQNRRDHMARRMHEYPNRKDREQNRMDPVAHPVMLIRSDDGGPKRVFYANPFDASDIRPVAGPPSPGRLARSATSASPLGASKRPGTALDGSPNTRSTAALRPNTAPNKDGFMFSRPQSQPNLHGRGRSPSPPHYKEEKVASGDPYERLREKLLGLIVQHRIIKEANLKQLFDKAIAINSHLDPVRLQAVIDGLRRELVDMPGDDAASAAGSASGSAAGSAADSSGGGSASAPAPAGDSKHSAAANDGGAPAAAGAGAGAASASGASGAAPVATGASVSAGAGAGASDAAAAPAPTASAAPTTTSAAASSDGAAASAGAGGSAAASADAPAAAAAAPS